VPQTSVPKLPAPLHWPAFALRIPAGRAWSLLEALLVAALALQVIRLGWLMAVPPAPLGTLPVPQSDRSPETSSRLAIDAFHPDASETATPSAGTSGLRLHALRAGPGRGSAIIAGADGRQRAFAAGDAVAPGVTLASIASDHVLLAASGTRQRLGFEPAHAAPAGARPAATALPSAATDRAGTGSTAAVDPAVLLSEAGLRPKTDGGRVAGYTIIPRGDGAVLRQAGLEPGDVLLSVNGQALTPERHASLASELAGGGPISLTFRRGDETRTTTLQAPTP
jgi:general secretion pathway protein C